LLKIISFLFLGVFLFGDVLKIYAKKVIEKNKVTYLKKPYIIYNDKLFIEADKGIVKNNHSIVLNGHVSIFYNDSIITSNKVDIVTKNDIKIDYVFYYDKKLEIWIKSKIASIKNKNTLYFKNSIFSSCCVNKPDWYIFAKKGNFNKESKYIKLYNLILYIHDVPVFYLPFYFSSLDKTRRSGLLRPYMGYSSTEGILYSQPIYFAPSVRYDLEITPTIRVERGKGIYSTFRFVDSPYSYGELKSGFFRDKSFYYEKYNLAHNSHYGYEFYYLRNKVTNKDKLYMDLKYANDVDFYYLNPFNYTFDTQYLTDKIITSYINYVKELDNSVLGIYNRYYIDTSKLSNKDTVQTIPQINFHVYEKKYYNLLTSFDYNFYYNFNQNHFQYYKNTFSIPLSLNFPLMNNYLNIKVSEIFNGVYAKQRHSDLPASFFLNAVSQFKLYTSLTKYSSFLHIINPSIVYTHKNFTREDIKNPSILTYSGINDNLSFNLFELFYFKDLYVDHTFNQLYDMDKNHFTKMENQINMDFKDISLTEVNKYDWLIKRVLYNTLGLGFKIGKNSFSINHIYQFQPHTKTIDFKASRDINNYKTVYFEYNYDILQKYVKSWMVGLKLNKKCWQYDFSFKKNIFPVLEQNGISYKSDNIIYFYINFYPLGGIRQTFISKGDR